MDWQNIICCILFIKLLQKRGVEGVKEGVQINANKYKNGKIFLMTK